MGLSSLKQKVGFGTNDKETKRLMNAMESLEICIATVHDDVGARLKDKMIQNLGVAGFGIGNVHKDWNRALDVDHGVKFYSAFATSEVCPWKQGQAQINGGRIQ